MEFKIGASAMFKGIYFSKIAFVDPDVEELESGSYCTALVDVPSAPDNNSETKGDKIHISPIKSSIVPGLFKATVNNKDIYALIDAQSKSTFTWLILLEHNA